MGKIILKSFFIIFMLISVLILPLFYPAGIAIYFRLFLLSLIFVESFKLFKIIFIDRKVHRLLSNAATVLFSFFIVFLVLEAIFMFIPRSHSADFTLASKLWYAKYWKPINSLGFRDKEPDYSHPVILFVGDSFTAGHGLKSVEDRFSDIVDREINKKKTKYSIINIARPNLDSRDEYEVMKNFIYSTRIKPAKIVLQYCGNDIEGAAAANGLIFDGFRPPPDMNKFLILIGSGSYLLNYIYFLFPKEYLAIPYITYLTRAYKDDNILSIHEQDLSLFVKYARENSLQLIVVVFPFLEDIEMSDSMFVNNIVNFFKANGICVMNVSQLVKNIPVQERIVNTNDGHASKKVNRIVAQEILKKLEE